MTHRPPFHPTTVVLAIVCATTMGCRSDSQPASDKPKAPPVAHKNDAPTQPTPPPASSKKPPIAPEPTAPQPSWRPGYKRPAVIDFHAHIMPSGLQKLATVMKENGLAYTVNLSGRSQQRGLSISVKMQQHFPALTNFYNPDWRSRNLEGFGKSEAKKLEEAVVKYAFSGLKISKALGLFLTDGAEKRIPVDWPELDPLWAKAGELGIPVMIHTGDPKAFWLPVDEHNERFDELKAHPSWSFHGPEHPKRETLLAERNRVIARHPKTIFVCVHFGGNPESLDDVDALLSTYPNAMLDTAARLGEIGRHPAEKVRAFFIKHKTRILFGTDIGLSGRGIMLGSTGDTPPTMKDVKPFYDAHWRFFEGSEKGIAHPTPIQGNWTIDAINLPDDVLDHLYTKNAKRLLSYKRSPVEGPAGKPSSP